MATRWLLQQCRAGAQKKPPKATGPRGAADAADFGSDWTVRRTSLCAVPFATDRRRVTLPASMPTSRSAARRNAIALKACAPDASPATRSRLVDWLAAPLRSSVAGRLGEGLTWVKADFSPAFPRPAKPPGETLAFRL